MGHIISCLPCFSSKPRQPIEISHPFPLVPKNGGETPIQSSLHGGSLRSMGAGVKFRRPLDHTPNGASPIGLGIGSLEGRIKGQHVRLSSEDTPPQTRTPSMPTRTHAHGHPRHGTMGYTDSDFTPYPQPEAFQLNPTRLYNDRVDGTTTFPTRHDPYNGLGRSRSPISSSTFSIHSPTSPVSPVSSVAHLGSTLEVWKTYARGLSILDTLDQSTEVSNASSESRSLPSRRRPIGTIQDLEEISDPQAQQPNDTIRQAPIQASPLVAPLVPPSPRPVQFPSPITSFRSNSTRSYRPKNKLRKVLRVEGDWEVVRGDEAAGSVMSMEGPTGSLTRGLAQVTQNQQ